MNKMISRLTLSGLSLSAVLLFAPPTRAADLSKYKSDLDITYVTNSRKSQTLNLYTNPALTWKTPLVIFIHGGAWSGRSKADGLDYADAFLQRGFAYASIDYRLSQEAIFPAQIEDAKAAVRYLRAHAADYHLDPDKIGVMGHSAGGQLVSLLGTTNEDRQFDVGENLTVSSAVQAVCDMSGPVDFLYPAPNLTSILTQLLGGPVAAKQDLAKNASPIYHIDAKSAPFLILHGDQDPAIPKEEAQEFADALQKAGVPAQMVWLPGQGHNLNVWAHTENTNFLNVILKFFDTTLKKHA